MNKTVQDRWFDSHLKIVNCSRQFVIGADEVGYGSFAGPVVVCAVKAPKDWNLEGLRDSKKIKTDSKRQEMRKKIEAFIEDGTISAEITERSSTHIDLYGLGKATQACFVQLFKQLYDDNSLLIADGNFNFDKHLGNAYLGVALPKADATIPAVMAASILAKTYRDDLMKRAHDEHPEYGWDTNVGYHSKEHVQALYKHGPTPYHRKSYKPIQKIIKRRSSYGYQIAQEIDEEILGDLLKLSKE